MAAPVEKGQILAGKYRVERVLGEGGMGVVVAATDTQLERMVAIKFLLPEYAGHGEAAARFMREARAAVKIQSEHIARVIDVNEMDSGSPYMVMEYLQGGDLSQIVESRGPLPVEEAVTYVIQACDAIAEAHSYGIVHRDLKPANLFLAKQPDGSSKVKVLDFGISKNTLAAADGTDPSLTRTSSMMGSPLYMSPEQMRSTKDVDSRTDIWALGVILYELLTTRLPFEAGSIPELSAKILLEDPDPMGRDDVPKALENIVQRTLAKLPAERFPSVAEFCMAIAPYGAKGARANVERISRLLTAAGLSTSQFDGLPTVPPASPDALEATRMSIEIEPGALPPSLAREHSGTVGQWGRTNGPALSRKSSGVGVWVGGAAVSLLLVGGGVFFAMGGTDSPGAVAAQPTPDSEAAGLHPEPLVAPVPTTVAGEAPDPENAPGAKPHPAERAPAAEQHSAEAAADGAEQPVPTSTAPSAAPTASSTGASNPTRQAPKPRLEPRGKVRSPAPATPAPTPKPVPKKTSLKDKFGSRK